MLYYLDDFTRLNQQKERPSQTKKSCWLPPPVETYKINSDASFAESTSTGGWGFVVRDSHGNFLEAGCGNLQRLSSALQGEALAALHSLERAVQLGMSRVILEALYGIYYYK